MKKIYALTDYKNNFGSKWKADPYRSGFDKGLLKKYFSKYNLEITFIKMKDIQFTSEWKGRLVIYTSSEEVGLDYKSYIEDVILGLERLGAIIIPNYDFLRANNNKVYMEILRDKYLGEEFSGNKSKKYGTLEELIEDINEKKITYPCVVKPASGSMSRGVKLAKNKKELIANVKQISSKRKIKVKIKESIRSLRYEGYQKESQYQNKYIVQKFIPNLNNDWKVLIYGDHYYILKRGIRSNDFRASGSHHNYQAGVNSKFPLKMLNMVEDIYHKLKVPHLSLDFAFDGQKGYVVEFQAVYFGTSTLELCNEYYTKRKGQWIVEKQNFDQEEEYAWALSYYLKDI